MPNKRIAELIERKLINGLEHPGDDGRKPITLMLPIFKTTGMSPEVQKQVDLTARLMAEAIVHAIETDGDSTIAPRSEINTMQDAITRAEGDVLAPRTVPVHCRCDRGFKDPLMLLTMRDGERVVVDGRVLLRGLAKRATDCPHKVTK